MTTELSQSRSEPREQPRQHEHEPIAADDERAHLQLLVGELLSENQRLRFENDGLRAQAEELEQQAKSAERGLAAATKWAGMVF
jgi:regulator of replication initiation timing